MRGGPAECFARKTMQRRKKGRMAIQDADQIKGHEFEQHTRKQTQGHTKKKKKKKKKIEHLETMNINVFV
jgi:hypothetical protein